MNWLNKLDSVLENGLTPKKPRKDDSVRTVDETKNPRQNSNNTDEVNPANLSLSSVPAIPRKRSIVARKFSDERKPSAKETRKQKPETRVVGNTSSSGLKIPPFISKAPLGNPQTKAAPNKPLLSKDNGLGALGLSNPTIEIKTEVPSDTSNHHSTSAIDNSLDNDDFEFDDFRVPDPLPVWNDMSLEDFDPSKNCFGVVHVRMLRAQQLPCPVGSSVCAAVSLPPYQGRVRTERTAAFLAPGEHGVCARWEHLSEAGLVSMVNAWNNEESPLPQIKIDMSFSPSRMAILEFSMCSISLDCHDLFQSPCVWKTQWCKTSPSDSKSKAGNKYLVENQLPLIQLEAMFMPSGTDDEHGEDQNALQQAATHDSSVNDEDEFHDTINDEASTVDQFSLPARQDDNSIMTGAVLQVAGDESFRAPTLRSGATISTHMTASASKQHLLRIKSFWVPAKCSVCSKVMVGKNSGFRCEVCSLDCCKDCRLNVDIELPCGSDAAAKVVQGSIQNKLSVGQIMNMVAPDESFQAQEQAEKSDKELAAEDSNGTQYNQLSSMEGSAEEAIGCFKINIMRACVFRSPMAADSDPFDVFDRTNRRDFRTGDYYLRISLDTGSKDKLRSSRTRTIQNTATPKFSTGEMRFNVPHFGTEFKIDLIDANNDTPIGTTLLTVQNLLHQQRDYFIHQNGVSLMQSLKGPLRFEGTQNLKLLLRGGVKSGFGNDFYVSPSADSSTKGGSFHPGSVSGWVEVDMGFEEYTDRLYGYKPYSCPWPPPSELNMATFQNHLTRVRILVDDLVGMVEQYNDAVSWKNPRLSFTCLVLFVIFCTNFNAEYSGSLPFLFLVAYMISKSRRRAEGGLKDRFVHREIESSRKVGKMSRVNYSLHRPFGRVRVAVHRGKNLYSRELGLPGNTAVRVYWSSIRLADDKEQQEIISYDPSAKTIHDIGYTDPIYKSDPVWGDMRESNETRRLHQLLPSEGDFFQRDDTLEKLPEIDFPILQPFRAYKSSMGEDGVYSKASLLPWTSSKGAIVVEIRFQDILNTLPGSEDVLGEVVVPFSKLFESRKISGWFQVMGAGSKELVPLSSSNEKGPRASEVERIPQVYLSLEWNGPQTSNGTANENELETSCMIQEELLRSSALAKDTNVTDLIETSIGAFNTALGLGGTVQSIQNSLGSLLDMIERVQNALNFTDPFKSSCIFLVILFIWFILMIIPTRYIILGMGLARHAMNFVSQLLKYLGLSGRSQPKDDDADGAEDREQQNASGSGISTWILNAFRGIPTDEDLRKVYFWESRRRGAEESERFFGDKRASRLERLWKAQWYSKVKLRRNAFKGGSQSDSNESSADGMEEAFAIVQGHRLLWWRSARDFDNGELPEGRLFLSGHAGLATPSPLEMRTFSQEEMKLVIAIFGRGTTGQERVTILAPSEDSKENLENTILNLPRKDE